MNTLLYRTLVDEPDNEKCIRGNGDNDMNQETIANALIEFAKTPEGQKFCEQAIQHYSKNHPEELVERRKTSLNIKPQGRGEKIRGTIEGLENYRKHNLAIVPFEILKSVLESHGVEFVDETGQVV